MPMRAMISLPMKNTFEIARQVIYSALALLMLLLISCGGTKKTVAVPVPATLPPLQESVINIPIKLFATPYLKQAETMAPTQFTSERWPDYLQTSCDFRYKYRFMRSGLGFACANNR